MDILLCEDDEALRETLRDLLESSGCTVTSPGPTADRPGRARESLERIQG